MFKLKQLPTLRICLKIMCIALLCITALISTAPIRAKMYTGIASAAWSPDGRWIAFTYTDSRSETAVVAMNSLYIMGVNGSSPKLLVEKDVDSFVWSPDGQQLAFSKTTTSGISIVSVNTIPPTVVQISKTGRFPTWSADGKKINYLGALYDLYQMETDGSNIQQLATLGKTLVAVWSLEWSPDRHTAAFVSPESKGEIYTLYVIDAQGTRILDTGRYVSGPLSWSPDGAKLIGTAYCGRRTSALCIYDVASGEKQLLGLGWNGLWSPNGKLIAFAKDSQLCVVTTDGSHERCLTEKQVNSSLMIHAWSPDSRSILISRAFLPNSGDHTVYRMDFTALIVSVEMSGVRRWLDAYMIRP